MAMAFLDYLMDEVCSIGMRITFGWGYVCMYH